MPDPATVLRNWFTAHADGDLAAAGSLMSSSTTIRVDGQVLHGFDEFMSWYDRRRASLPGLRYEVLDVLGGETHAAAVIRLSAGDRTWRQVAVYEISEGRIVSVTAYEDLPEP